MTEYLIHDDTYFCVNSNSLRHIVGNEARVINLDNLESKILLYFIDHPGIAISKDELMKLWNAQYVMEHSLTRVISTLRKKLEKLNNLAFLIKTIPREGYQYNGTAIVVGLTETADGTNAPDTINTNSSNINSTNSDTTSTHAIRLEPKNQKSMVSMFVALLVLAILVVSIGMHLTSPKEKLLWNTEPSVLEIMDNLVLKEDAIMNPDGEKIVYSSQVPSEEWFLKVVSLDRQFSWSHKQSGYDLVAPVWLNKEELVYIMLGSNQCFIKKINIYKQNDTGDGTLISNCNAKQPSRALSVLDENTILVSDSENISLPKQLMSIDINTGKKSVFYNSSLSGAGTYRVFTSPNKTFVATLASQNWFDTDIQIFDADNLEEPYWEKNVNYPLFSIALGDSTLVYKDQVGRFRVIDFVKSAQKDEMSIPLIITRPVYSPTYAPNGFFFTEGDKFSHKVVSVDLNNQTETVLNDISGVSTRTPILVNEGQELLYSSKQTGINQVWKRDLESGQYTQISNFAVSSFIEKIVVDESESKIAVETNKGIILGSFDDAGKMVEEKMIAGDLPSFWRGDLLYSKVDSEKTVIYRYNQNEDSTTPLIQNGAYKTTSDNGVLFYSKYHASGIWQFNESGADQLVQNGSYSYIGEDWDIFEGYLYFRDTDNNINKLSILKNRPGNVERLKGNCHRIAIAQENVCLSVVGKASINRLLKYSFN